MPRLPPDQGVRLVDNRGQIDRLLQTGQPAAPTRSTDRPAAELASHAEQIRQAVTALDDTLHAILDPLTETEPEPGEDED